LSLLPESEQFARLNRLGPGGTAATFNPRMQVNEPGKRFDPQGRQLPSVSTPDIDPGYQSIVARERAMAEAAARAEAMKQAEFGLKERTFGESVRSNQAQESLSRSLPYRQTRAQWENIEDPKLRAELAGQIAKDLQGRQTYRNVLLPPLEGSGLPGTLIPEVGSGPRSLEAAARDATQSPLVRGITPKMPAAPRTPLVTIGGDADKSRYRSLEDALGARNDLDVSMYQQGPLAARAILLNAATHDNQTLETARDAFLNGRAPTPKLEAEFRAIAAETKPRGASGQW
jgi:hypothetical protein